MATIRFLNKFEVQMLLRAIETSIDIDTDMAKESSIGLDERVAMLSRAGNLGGGKLIIIDWISQNSELPAIGHVQVSSDVFSAVSHAVNLECQIFNDTFDDEPYTSDRGDMLIAINRLDERLG
jgi:hypothetical protein